MARAGNAVNGGTYKASQVVRISRGGSITFTNNDVMRHTLIQTKSGKIALSHAKTDHHGHPGNGRPIGWPFLYAER